jgi:hypothetical protein
LAFTSVQSSRVPRGSSVDAVDEHIAATSFVEMRFGLGRLNPIRKRGARAADADLVKGGGFDAIRSADPI